MKLYLSAISLIFWLTGCASALPTLAPPNTPLTLYFSQEQLTLTEEQKRQLTELLLFKPSEQPQLRIAFSPTQNDDPFQALMEGKKRLAGILAIAHPFAVKITPTYRPTQQANTILLQYE